MGWGRLKSGECTHVLVFSERGKREKKIPNIPALSLLVSAAQGLIGIMSGAASC